MKKLENLGRHLNKIEQKNIKGGIEDDGGYMRCECDGCVGAWSYTSLPSCSGVAQDVRDYCRCRSANCSGRCSF